MKVIYGLDQVEPPIAHCVLTVGNFDGVHVGHREILRRARGFAIQFGCPVVALTFDPHPLAVVAPSKAPLRLTPLPERIQRLADAGADVIVVAGSDRQLLGMEAETFVREVLVARFHPLCIVEGSTFGFGKGRKGTPRMLQAMAGELGWTVEIVEPVSIVGDQGKAITVSSSLIRRLIMEGDLWQAAQCLSRPYALASIVVRGAGRGRSIGFPTANVAMPEGQVEPAEGVYAGRTSVGGTAFASAISIGRSETFGKNERQIESHLLDFDGDLYGKLIRVEFVRRVRAQQKFSSVGELVEQIRRDVCAVKDALKGLL